MVGKGENDGLVAFLLFTRMLSFTGSIKVGIVYLWAKDDRYMKRMLECVCEWMTIYELLFLYLLNTWVDVF